MNEDLTQTEISNYITNTGCEWEWRDMQKGSWHSGANFDLERIVYYEHEIRIALTDHGLPSHLPPHIPDALPAKQITEGGKYRAVTLADSPKTKGMQYWSKYSNDWTPIYFGVEHIRESRLAEEVTLRLPAATPFPDWDEMSTATVRKSRIVQPVVSETPETDSALRYCTAKLPRDEWIPYILGMSGTIERHRNQARHNHGVAMIKLEKADRDLTAANAANARLREALEKVKGYGRGDMGHQQMCDYVTEVAEEALTPQDPSASAAPASSLTPPPPPPA